MAFGSFGLWMRALFVGSRAPSVGIELGSRLLAATSYSACVACVLAQKPFAHKSVGLPSHSHFIWLWCIDVRGAVHGAMVEARGRAAEVQVAIRPCASVCVMYVHTFDMVFEAAAAPVACMIVGHA